MHESDVRVLFLNQIRLHPLLSFIVHFLTAVRGVACVDGVYRDVFFHFTRCGSDLGFLLLASHLIHFGLIAYSKLN